MNYRNQPTRDNFEALEDALELLRLGCKVIPMKPIEPGPPVAVRIVGGDYTDRLIAGREAQRLGLLIAP